MRDFKCTQFDCKVPCECKGCKESSHCNNGYCVDGDPIHNCGSHNPQKALPPSRAEMCVDWT